MKIQWPTLIHRAAISMVSITWCNCWHFDWHTAKETLNSNWKSEALLSRLCNTGRMTHIHHFPTYTSCCLENRINIWNEHQIMCREISHCTGAIWWNTETSAHNYNHTPYPSTKPSTFLKLHGLKGLLLAQTCTTVHTFVPSIQKGQHFVAHYYQQAKESYLCTSTVPTAKYCGGTLLAPQQLISNIAVHWKEHSFP